MVRFKRRYALCEVIYPHNARGSVTGITDKMIFNAVKDALIEMHGDLGMATFKFSLAVKYANKDTNMVIIRGDRNHFDLLTSAIVFVQKLNGYDAILNTLYIGGSIRCCHKFVIKYHKRNLPLLYPSCTTEEEREAIMTSIMEACESSMRKEAPIEEEPVSYSNLDMIVSSDQIS